MSHYHRELALSNAGPHMHCDLCPSFTLELNDDKFDVHIVADEGGQKWFSDSEEVQGRLRSRFHQLLKSVGDVTTADAVRKFKIGVAQALIREVQAGHLFRSETELEEEDDGVGETR
jgi:hypothetical protein